MLSFAAALHVALEHAAERGPPLTRVVDLAGALGKVPCRNIESPINVPANAASIKDGFALLARQPAPARLKLAKFSVQAGDSEPRVLALDECAYVTTGAVLPHGADCVVEVEATTVVEGEVVFANPQSIRASADVRLPGSDFAKGMLLVPAGHPIGPSEVGLLAMVGMDRVIVYETPNVAIFSTGNELVAPKQGTVLNRGQVFDCNLPMLIGAASELGCVTHDLGVARDDMDDLERRLKRADSLGCDVLIISGGVSEGKFDLVRPLVTQLGGQVHFSKVSTKPGKPVTFATLPQSRMLIFALPGNPCSAIVMFNTLVAPVLRRIAGLSRVESRHIPVRLAHDVVLDNQRPEFQRASLEVKMGVVTASTTGAQRSSRLVSMLNADVVLDLPQGQSIAKGTEVSAILLRDLRRSAGLCLSACRFISMFTTPTASLLQQSVPFTIQGPSWRILGEAEVVAIENLPKAIQRATLRVASSVVLIVLVGNAKEMQTLKADLREAGFKHTPGVGEQVRASAESEALMSATVECSASLHVFCLVEIAGPAASIAVNAALAVLDSVCELV